MTKTRNFLFLVVIALVMSFLNHLPGGSLDAQAATAGHFKKVMVVILENTNFDDAVSQPFLSKLIKNGAFLQNFYAEAHPSQPNYLALISGSTQGVKSDAIVNLSGRHVGDLLEEKGLDWKVYAEQYPGNCFLKATSGTYVRKHTPFLSFKNVSGDPRRCEKMVEAGALADDIKSGQIPPFSLYIPDMNNDGHDTGVAYADKWLSKAFGPLIADPSFMKDMLLVVTFDESEGNGANHVFTVMYGNTVAPGSVSDVKYTHYSLLRTVEDELGLGTLNASDSKASAITDIWK